MIKTASLALAVTLTCTAASAQTEDTGRVSMVMLTDCATAEYVKQYIYRDLREVPFSGGWGIMQRDDGRFAEGMWKIYASPDWGSFTVAIEFADGMMCLVGMGSDIAPFED